MEYRYLGRSALKVSPLTLGSMMFGGPTDEATSHRIIARAHEQGINFIDTADVYHDGQSESVVGRAIQNNRHYWVLATKFGYSRAGQPNVGGQSRKWIIKSVEDSLRRLGTDYIDILYFHHATFDAPLGEGVRAIADLIRQGKLRHFGVSNFRGWRIGEVAQLADEQGIDRPVASQPLYNIVNRTAEVEQIPAANHFGLGVVTYSPLARGVLTGKYQPNAVPAADSRVGRSDKRVLETEWRPESLQVTQRIQEHLSGRDVTPADFALAWVLNNRQVTSAIAGPRTEEQWDQYQRALQVRITAEDEAFVNQLVSPGHTSTLGFTDPGHPVEGRAPR